MEGAHGQWFLEEEDLGPVKGELGCGVKKGHSVSLGDPSVTSRRGQANNIPKTRFSQDLGTIL